MHSGPISIALIAEKIHRTVKYPWNYSPNPMYMRCKEGFTTCIRNSIVLNYTWVHIMYPWMILYVLHSFSRFGLRMRNCILGVIISTSLSHFDLCNDTFMIIILPFSWLYLKVKNALRDDVSLDIVEKQFETIHIKYLENKLIK